MDEEHQFKGRLATGSLQMVGDGCNFWNDHADDDEQPLYQKAPFSSQCKTVFETNGGFPHFAPTRKYIPSQPKKTSAEFNGRTRRIATKKIKEKKLHNG